jgi:hypothetical protein
MGCKGSKKERKEGRKEEMKDPKEIQIAWDIWNLIERFNDLLWNRYEEDFLEIYLQEEGDKFLRTIGHPSLTRTQDKTEG